MAFTYFIIFEFNMRSYDLLAESCGSDFFQAFCYLYIDGANISSSFIWESSK